MKKVIFAVVVLSIAVIWSCQKEITQVGKVNASYTLKLTFKNMVGNDSMKLGNTYQNPFNEAYTITTFKYYISNIILQQNNETAVAVPGIYHLVDEANADTKSFSLTLDQNKFNRLTFLIGVDSARNVSGTQTGDLDPLKGMFWTWNSGYIMAKLEANSPASTAPANKVEIHVGGFKTGENALRPVSLDLSPTGTIDIKENGTSEILFTADANKWFNGVHDMKIADHPVLGMPGAVALNFADNYANMFKVVSVTNN